MATVASSDFNYDEMDLEPKNIVHDQHDNEEEKKSELLSLTVSTDNGREAYVFTSELRKGVILWNCHVCNYLSSWKGILKHVSTDRHATSMMKYLHPTKNFVKFVDALTSQFISGEPLPPGMEDAATTGMICLINETLDKCTKPLIGVEFLIEIQEDRYSEPKYECLLCLKRGDPRTIIVHLTSNAHYTYYLRKYFPKLYNLASKLPKSIECKPKVNAVVSHLIGKIEERYGRLLNARAVSADMMKEQRSIIGRAIFSGKHISETAADVDLEEMLSIEYVENPELLHQNFPLRNTKNQSGNDVSFKRSSSIGSSEFHRSGVGNKQFRSRREAFDSDDDESKMEESKVARKELSPNDVLSSQGAVKVKYQSSQSEDSNDGVNNKPVPSTSQSSQSSGLHNRYGEIKPRSSIQQLDSYTRRNRSNGRSRSRDKHYYYKSERGERLSPPRRHRSPISHYHKHSPGSRRSPRYSSKYVSRYSLRRSPRHSSRRSPRYSPRRSPRYSPRRSPRYSPRRSPRYSPHRSPRHSPHRSPRHSPHRSPRRSPHRSPRHSPHRSPRHSPHRSPRLSPRRSPRNSPHRSPRYSPPHWSPTYSPRRSPTYSPRPSSNLHDPNQNKERSVERQTEIPAMSLSSASDSFLPAVVASEKQPLSSVTFDSDSIPIPEEMIIRMQYYDKNPEKHPAYEEEWKKFWNKRYKEIQTTGTHDPNKYDYRPEWIKYWEARMKELFDEEASKYRTEINMKRDMDKEREKRNQKSIEVIDIDDDDDDKVVGSNNNNNNNNDEKESDNKVTVTDIKNTWKALTGSDMRDSTDVDNKKPIEPNSQTSAKKYTKPNKKRSLSRTSTDSNSDSASSTTSVGSNSSISSSNSNSSRDGGRCRRRHRSSKRARKYRRVRSKSRSRHRRRGRSASSQSSHRRSSSRDSRSLSKQRRRRSTSNNNNSNSNNNNNNNNVAGTRRIRFDNPLNVITVLRQLTVLDAQLGNLSNHVIALLSAGLAMEKRKPGSSIDVLTSENILFLETCKEKIKAQFLAGLVPKQFIKANLYTVRNIEELLKVTLKFKKLSPPPRIPKPPDTLMAEYDRVKSHSDALLSAGSNSASTDGNSIDYYSYYASSFYYPSILSGYPGSVIPSSEQDYSNVRHRHHNPRDRHHNQHRDHKDDLRYYRSSSKPNDSGGSSSNNNRHPSNSDKKPALVDESSAPISDSSVATVDKVAIAQQIAAALTAEGRTDVSQDELERLINVVVNQVTVNGDKTATTGNNNDNNRILNPISNDDLDDISADEDEDLPVTHNPALLTDFSSNNTDNDKTNGSELFYKELSDKDLINLLSNFDGLTEDEQLGLMRFMKNLSEIDPNRAKGLTSYTAELNPSSNNDDDNNRHTETKIAENDVDNVTKNVIDDDDDDNYTLDDVYKAAARNVLQDVQLNKTRRTNVISMPGFLSNSTNNTIIIDNENNNNNNSNSRNKNSDSNIIIREPETNILLDYHPSSVVPSSNNHNNDDDDDDDTEQKNIYPFLNNDDGNRSSADIIRNVSSSCQSSSRESFFRTTTSSEDYRYQDLNKSFDANYRRYTADDISSSVDVRQQYSRQTTVPVNNDNLLYSSYRQFDTWHDSSNKTDHVYPSSQNPTNERLFDSTTRNYRQRDHDEQVVDGVGTGAEKISYRDRKPLLPTPRY